MECTLDMADQEMMTNLLEVHGKLIDHSRKATHIADNVIDEGTIDMMVGCIRDIQKISWMLDGWRMKTISVMTK